MKKETGIILYDAMRTSEAERPCEKYRSLVCSICNSRKACNDLDVIMCGLAYLISHSFEHDEK